jgi:hypothetical protein
MIDLFGSEVHIRGQEAKDVSLFLSRSHFIHR